MKKKVVFVLLDGYADWEYAFLATTLRGHILDKTSPYDAVMLSLTKDPIQSMGGVMVLPDYGVVDMPEDYAGIILIGGTSWRTPEACAILPLVQNAFAENKVVGAICDATVFLGMHGLLNNHKHTSNTLEDLQDAAGDAYTGQVNYQNVQAVRDGNFITANGTGYLEFTRECLLALEAYPQEYVLQNYEYFKQGYIAFAAALQAQSK